MATRKRARLSAQLADQAAIISSSTNWPCDSHVINHLSIGLNLNTLLRSSNNPTSTIQKLLSRTASSSNMAIDPYRNCNFDTPGYLCTLETCCLAQSSFTYRVNLPGNLFFATLFGLLIIPQLAMAIRYRIKGYAVAMIFGLAFEVIGYTGRIQLHYNPFNALGFYM